jgi:iron-sulfur cluster insertion protein
MFDISDNAINKIREIALKENQKYFRVSVNGGGCQGFSYNFKFDKNVQKNDKLFNFSDISILIDSASYDFLKDSKLDFIDDLVGSYFKVLNPNASSTCGCGTSFSV